MTQEKNERISRRSFLVRTASGVGVAAAATALSAAPPAKARAAAPVAQAKDPELEPYLKAGIDWQQARGETITVMVIPWVGYDIMQELSPMFTKLSGVNVRYQIIPPLQLREKHILDLSTKAGQFASTATDPMYYPLYVSNKWVEDLEPYINDPKLTNREWLDLADFVPAWLGTGKHKGKQYGLPYMGECALHIYRTDVYEKKGVPLPETLAEFIEAAAKLHDPANNLYGAVMRGFKGPGQNMYVWPPIFRMFGGEWFDKDDKPIFNSKAGVDALAWYCELNQKYAPSAATNWNWPEIADAFAAGTIVQYMDGIGGVGVFGDPKKSKVVGKVGFRGMPKGPAGKRVSTIWTWSFPINASISDRAKRATWLWAQWMSSKAFQARSTYEYGGDKGRRSADAVRLSIWQDERYRKTLQFGKDFEKSMIDTLASDLDPGWRPLVPQWPEMGNILATAVQKALVKQATPKAALDEAAAQVAEIMKKG
jgi:ABC-type glycerol-3-phosphate transport system substrate-binding protein